MATIIHYLTFIGAPSDLSAWLNSPSVGPSGYLVVYMVQFAVNKILVVVQKPG